MVALFSSIWALWALCHLVCFKVSFQSGRLLHLISFSPFLELFSWFKLCLFCLVRASSARVSVSPGLNKLHLAVLGVQVWTELSCVFVVSTGPLCWPFLPDPYKRDNEGQACAEPHHGEREKDPHPFSPYNAQRHVPLFLFVSLVLQQMVLIYEPVLFFIQKNESFLSNNILLSVSSFFCVGQWCVWFIAYFNSSYHNAGLYLVIFNICSVFYSFRIKVCLHFPQYWYQQQQSTYIGIN